MRSTSWAPEAGAGAHATRPPARRARTRRRRRPGPPPPPELREAGLHPRKSLGQHFLSDRRILGRIVDAVLPVDVPSETVIEVGAGLGALTTELAKRARRLVAVEVDEGLAAYLTQRLAPFENVTVVRADVLALSPAELLARGSARPPYAVVGNLPYYIAAPVLRHFLEAQPPPTHLVVMMQREVAESVAARPGRLSLLGVSVQLYGEVRLLFSVPPSAFYPPPKVRSAVLRIDVSSAPRVDIPSRDLFFQVARAGFSAPRKQLRNALAQGLGLEPAAAASLLGQAGLEPRRRAQELSLEEWAALSRAWAGGRSSAR